MVDFAVVPERTALLNIDLQNGFVQGAPDGFQTRERINRLAVVCREAGILVIHTSHMLRPDGSNMGVLGEMVPKSGFRTKINLASNRRSRDYQRPITVAQRVRNCDCQARDVLVDE